MRHGQRTADQRGLTLMEVLISILASTIIILGIGRIVTTNQSMISGGTHQAELQQELSRVFGLITSDVRSARSVVNTAEGEFRTYDKSGNELHVYQLTGSGNGARILRDGAAVTDRICAVLTAAGIADSTYIELDMTFADLTGNRVAGHSAVSVRNRTTGF